MEPQPGSPTSPPFSPGTTTLWDDNARAATPSEEMAAPDETKEEAPDETKEGAIDAELEPARKSSASSSSSSSSSSSASSADIPCDDIEVIDLVNPLAAVPPEPEVDEHDTDAKAVDTATPPEDERAAPSEAKPADIATPERGQEPPVVVTVEAKPDDWVTWPEPPPPAADDDSFASSDGGGGGGGAPALPPQVPTVSPAANPGPAASGPSGFDPGRIPASVFQHRASVSQAEWSMASNESLFSIQGAGDMCPGSRSHFDFYYDEAMAESAAAGLDSKLPSLAEGAEVPESREFPLPAPGSADSAARAANDAKKAAVFRRQESGSGGSSSNFSFAFPILAETSPRKKDVVVNSALYQPLGKEREQRPATQLEPPVSAFMEMTTEEERRRSDAGCCCCGCCWFDCSWCCRCPPWRCGCGCCCSCSCPRFCRCSWCLCS